MTETVSAAAVQTALTMKAKRIGPDRESAGRTRFRIAGDGLAAIATEFAQ